MNFTQKEKLNEIIKALAESNFFSENYKLDNKAVEVSTKVTKYILYKVTLKHSTAPREVSFSIADYFTHLRVFLTIYNLDGESHYSISLDNFLEKFCNVKNAKDRMLLDKYTGETVHEKLKSFLQYLKSILSTRFFKILEGEDWEEIPFDWGPYK